MGAIDIMLSFPSLILALALLRLCRRRARRAGSLGKVTFVLTVLAIPALARITRANTLTYSRARVRHRRPGAGSQATAHRSRSEILPNVLPSMISFSFVALGDPRRRRGRAGVPRAVGRGAGGDLGQAHPGRLREARRRAPPRAHPRAGSCSSPCSSLNYIGDRLQARFSAARVGPLMSAPGRRVITPCRARHRSACSRSTT